MGNRAIIKIEKGNIGVYLHWNGGRDSVEAFLKYCKMRGFRSPETDGYGWARFAQIVGNFFGGGLSVGIIDVSDVDIEWIDNGAYVIRDWEIVGREGYNFEEQNEYSMEEMLEAIDKAQPERDRLGDFLKAEEILAEEVKIGDVVFVRFWDSISKEKIVGFGDDRVVNGREVLGVPYIGRWGSDSCKAEDNINNYLFDERVRVYRGKN